MKSIFPSAIDGDLLKLVHLSNGFQIVEGTRTLHVGDVCRAEARIVAVTNSNEGKMMTIMMEEEPLIAGPAPQRGWLWQVNGSLAPHLLASRLRIC
jgi:hypothetical protein